MLKTLHSGMRRNDGKENNVLPLPAPKLDYSTAVSEASIKSPVRKNPMNKKSIAGAASCRTTSSRRTPKARSATRSAWASARRCSTSTRRACSSIRRYPMCGRDDPALESRPRAHDRNVSPPGPADLLQPPRRPQPSDAPRHVESQARQRAPNFSTRATRARTNGRADTRRARKT